jgi:hypothetical protein
MNTTSPRVSARNFMASVASLAAVGALALTTSSGGTAPARYGAMSPGSRGLDQRGMFIPDGNWAGYGIPSVQDDGYVSGVWTVPAINCRKTQNALDGVWAGLGGVNGQALLQTGVSDSCKGGVEDHFAWWELVPGYPDDVDFKLAVSAGDVMEASVYHAASGHWVTRIDNLTTGWSGWMISGETYGVGRDGSGSFTDEGSARFVSYAGGNTAEWIVEHPTVDGSVVVSTPDFGTVRFSELRTGLSWWSLKLAEVYELFSGRQRVAVPGPPIGDGFSVSYVG